jgi:hypothetical protein
MLEDVPSPIDLRLMSDARAWEQSSMEKRPYRAEFIERSFKEAGWGSGLGTFQCVVTNQAIHELRNKRHASTLHAQVRTLLGPDGSYLVCDHFVGENGVTNEQLLMTIEEQREALLSAGFRSVRQVLLKGSLVLHHAT